MAPSGTTTANRALAELRRLKLRRPDGTGTADRAAIGVEHSRRRTPRLWSSTFQLRKVRHPSTDKAVGGLRRIALVEDVYTEGSTIRAVAHVLKASNPQLEVVAAAAGQMTIRAAVVHENDLTA
jgi:hypothetical protein